MILVALERPQASRALFGFDEPLTFKETWKMNRCFCAGLAAMLVIILPGCNSTRKAPMGRVSGKVTLDGHPMKDGAIYFIPSGGEVATEVPIKDGAFAGEAVVGTSRIQFAVWEVKMVNDPKTPGATGEQKTNILPARFHIESKETREVGAGDNSFDFAITSH
jgi:hypothetical protein